MIINNEEIVTYLKGEENLKDDYFISEWAKYSSLIKKDKDPGQYLSYLFIIYYFGPNEIIQDAAKKLIDDISPKEILQFHEKFRRLVKKLDNDIVSLYRADESFLYADIYSENSLDELPSSKKDEEGQLYNNNMQIYLKEEFEIIKDTHSWFDLYFEVFLLPIRVMPCYYKKIDLKVKLIEYKSTCYFIDQLVKDVLIIPKSLLNNHLHANHNFLNYFEGEMGYFDQDLLDDIYDTKIITSGYLNIINLIAQTKENNAISLFKDILDNYNSFDTHDFCHHIAAEIDILLEEFDDCLTNELRLESEFLEIPKEF